MDEIDESYYVDLRERTRQDADRLESSIGEQNARLGRMKSRLISLRKLQDLAGEFLASDDPSVARQEINSGPLALSAPRKPIVDEPDRVPHAEIAEAILRKFGEPAKVGQILQEMQAMGHPLPEKEMQHTAIYSSMLRRPKTFIRLGGGHWALTEWASANLLPTFSESEELAEARQVAAIP